MNIRIRRIISISLLPFLVVIAIAMAPTAASAQIQIFAKIGDIAGGSTIAIDDIKDWIDVISLHQAYPSNKKGACQVEIVKGIDIAGPKLWLAAVQRTHIPEAKIEVMAPAGGGTLSKLYTIYLKEVAITSIATAGEPTPTVADTFQGITFAETVTLSGTEVELTYYPVNPDGSPGGKVSTKFECD